MQSLLLTEYSNVKCSDSLPVVGSQPIGTHRKMRESKYIKRKNVKKISHIYVHIVKSGITNMLKCTEGNA